MGRDENTEYIQPFAVYCIAHAGPYVRYQLQIPVRVLVTVTMPCPDAQNCYQWAT